MTAPTAAELAAVPMFASLAPAALEDEANCFVIRCYPKGATVANAGDRLDAFNVILSGSIQWFWRDDADHLLKRSTEGLGGHFADTTLGGEPILMSVTALEDLRVASIPITDLRPLLLRHPELAVGRLMDVVARLRRLLVATRFTRAWNIDMSRDAQERLPARVYLSSSYYERWALGIAANAVARGLIDADELAAGHALRPGKPVARVMRKDDVGHAFTRGAFGRPASGPARFAPGDRVRTRNINPPTHTRLPR